MRPLILIFFFLITISAAASLNPQASADSGRNTIVEYPQALQKAGVKKVRCIFKDSRKFIWIGTDNGLYRYDGTNVDLIQHDGSNPHSLPQNTVVSITEDRRGHIWAGTLRGAADIDPVSFSCQVYNIRRHNLKQEYDIKIYIDNKGKVWAIGSRGLDYLDTRQNRFIKAWEYGVKNKQGAGYINCITEWGRDTLILGTFDGAVFINRINFGFRRVIVGNNIAVVRAFTDNYNRLWLGTWGRGCMVYDSNGRQLATVIVEDAKPGELTNVITGIIGAHYNHNNVIWVSTMNGVYKITGYTGSITSLEKASKTIVSAGYTANLMADDDQYIWKAGNIVSRFFAGSNFFKTIPLEYSGNVQDICPLTLNGKKSVALLTWYSSSGLVIADPESGKVLYRQPQQSNRDPSNVGGIAQDKFKRLWVSSLAGVQVYDERFKKVYNLNEAKAARDKLLSRKTNFIFIKNDTVWVVCYKRGVDLYDLNFHKIKSFTPGDGSGLKDDFIQRIYADHRGRVWLLGNSNLYLYSSAKNSFRAFNFNQDSTSFAANDMAELPNGDLLIASDAGLFRMNPANFKYEAITTPLIDNRNIFAVSVDNHGDIWFVNEEHLVYYKVKGRHFIVFGHEDGLNNAAQMQWLRLIYHKYFFLATDKQLVTFSPGDVARQSQPIKLYFHDVEANDSTLAKGTFSTGLRLNYNENRLNIGFGAINYIKPEQNVYAYQLTGIDSHWVYTPHNFVSYANLAPGTYKFKLKASNYAGIWSTSITMNIEVYPPFWATWWFRMLSFLLFGSILFIAIRYVLQRNLREKILKLEKEQAVEKERNRIARDMHDDLGSGLTKIAILSEVAKTQVASAQASANLDVISNASRELVDNLQDIIWVLNPKNDSLNSLIFYIKEYAESFFEPAGLQYEFSHNNVDGTITLSEEQRRNIFLSIKEICNNILKHADCTQVCISLLLAHRILIISIRDNGRGFAPDEVGIFSNGLQNIRNRMDQIGANFSIDSEKNTGTVAKLSIPV